MNDKAREDTVSSCSTTDPVDYTHAAADLSDSAAESDAVLRDSAATFRDSAFSTCTVGPCDDPHLETPIALDGLPDASSEQAESDEQHQRNIRISASSLDLAAALQMDFDIPPEVQRESEQPSCCRRCVTFDTSLHPDLDESDSEATTSRGRRSARLSASTAVRRRSSSMGRVSMVTTSVYSIGDINMAVNGMVTPAQTVHFNASTSTIAEPPEERRIQETAKGMVDALMRSSSAIRRAFTTEKQHIDRHTASQETSASLNEEPSPLHTRPRTFSLRCPPPPPHLVRSSTAPRFTLGPPDSPSSLANDSVESLHAVDELSLAQISSPDLSGTPPRQNSLTRLWRQLSNGKPSKKTKGVDDDDWCGFGQVSPSSRIRREASLRAGPIDPMIPEVDRTGRIMVTLNSRPDSRSGSRSSSFARLRQAEDDGQPLDIPSPANRTSSLPFTVSHRSSSLHLASSIAGVDSPKQSDAPVPNSSHDIMTSTAANVNEILIRRVRTEPHDFETRRKYRQTLVEIKDDRVFQQVLEGLTRLEADARGDGHTEKPPQSPGLRRTLSMVSVDLNTRNHFRAWFVTRELVQGERRHGRLLARGVDVSGTMH